MSEEQAPTPEEVDVEALRAALKSANDEAASHRHKNKELTEQIEQANATATKYKTSYVGSKVSAALTNLGANANLSRYVDQSKLELDDAGEIVGLGEQVEELQQSFPELFEAKRRAPRIDAADKPAVQKTLTSAEKLLQQARAK